MNQIGAPQYNVMPSIWVMAAATTPIWFGIPCVVIWEIARQVFWLIVFLANIRHRGQAS